MKGEHHFSLKPPRPWIEIHHQVVGSTTGTRGQGVEQYDRWRHRNFLLTQSARMQGQGPIV